MKKENRPIVIWLSIVLLLILSMVMVGGITRLTHSGLSIAEWKPVSGIIPPLSEKSWQEDFSKYQETPEYKKINHGMSLSEFKGIFFWEYFHRLLGRLIGFIYFVPFLIFLVRGRLRGGLGKRLFIGLLLGSLEGPMGWCMVKSGLVNDPHVSHFRLTAHLMLAFLLFGYLLWVILDLIKESAEKNLSGRLKFFLGVILVGVVIETIYGGFTAGLKAGFGYNTFPKMNGHWLPPDLFFFGRSDDCPVSP